MDTDGLACGRCGFQVRLSVDWCQACQDRLGPIVEMTNPPPVPDNLKQ